MCMHILKKKYTEKENNDYRRWFSHCVVKRCSSRWQSAPDTLAMDNNKCVKTEDSQEPQLNILSTRDNLWPFVHNQKNKIQQCLVCSPPTPQSTIYWFPKLIHPRMTDNPYLNYQFRLAYMGWHVYIMLCYMCVRVYTSRKEVYIYIMSFVIHDQ